MAHRFKATRKTKGAQALILAALIVAATIYGIYALTLNYTQSVSQPLLQEVYTEALIQALAAASYSHNSSYATQVFYDYLNSIAQLNSSLRLLAQSMGEPVFNYYAYDQKLCVGCNVSATAVLGPYSVNISLTLITQNQASGEYILRAAYVVDGQSLPIYKPQVTTTLRSNFTWIGNNLQIQTQPNSVFTLTVLTSWGLELQCLL